MRRLLMATVVGTVLLVVVLPVAVLYFWTPAGEEERVKITPGQVQLRVLLKETGEVVTMELEEYLVGVVAAEMPAVFAPEALKAQAVVARTYALKRKEIAAQGGNPHHPEADVCNDPTHCQAWHAAKELRARWGLLPSYLYRRKIEAAVQETAGVVATYQGKLIDPVYHSTSNGNTENSEDVWKLAVPYLRSVESPWDLVSPKYHAQVTFEGQEVATRLGLAPEALGTGQELPFQVLELTGGGRIKRIRVGDKVLSGEEFRRLLNLNSAAVTWERQGDRITFTTKGYGHGVGMSQYGANGMAQEGYTYQQILSYYYTGIQLYRITE